MLKCLVEARASSPSFPSVKKKEAMTLITDKTWEVQIDKKWIPAKVVHNYGAGPWKRVFERAIPTKPGQNMFDGPSVRAALVKNDFLMRPSADPTGIR